jgi:hypothetical protein
MDGTAHCDMCGTTARVDTHGRCDLGHWVGVAQPENFPPVEAPAETGPAAPPVSAGTDTPPPSSEAPEARSSQGAEDPFFHPYDEVLAEEAADEPASSAPEPGPAPALAPDELEDLLSWDDGGTDVDLAEEEFGEDDER